MTGTRARRWGLVAVACLLGGCGGPDAPAAGNSTPAGEARAHGPASEAQATPAKPCPRREVTAGIKRFLRAANSGSERRLRRTIATGRAFRVYSQGQSYGRHRRPRNFFSTKDRDELIAQLIKRRRKGDRFRLRTLDLGGGYDRSLEICNVGFTLKRRIGGGPWRPFIGKGALDQPTLEISVWNIGPQIRAGGPLDPAPSR